jgi:DNA-directed RNA polymerase subunit beta'
VGANLGVLEGTEVAAGDVLAKMPREATKTKDITGGLPRVAELFEARKPKDVAIVSEIEGTVSFGPDSRGKRRVIVTPDGDGGEPREYLIPKGKHISVHENDRVRAGEGPDGRLVEPARHPQGEGPEELAKYLVDEVQEVYRLQGVRINDKHIEVIVRQMLRRVRVKEVGDTDFLVGEQVEKMLFDRTNEQMLARASSPPRRRRSCSASPRPRSRPSRSSRRRRSRRRPRCSPRRRCGAASTTCAVSRRT